jgi:hypothetical protein
MNNNDKILKYLSDLMDEEEKYEFEKELKSSPELKTEYGKIKNSLDFLKSSQPKHSDQRYFNSLLPSIRSRIDERRKKFQFKPSIAFGLSIVIAVFTVVLLEMNEPSQSNLFYSYLSEAAEEMVESGSYSDYESYIIQNYYSENLYNGQDEITELLENEYVNEIVSSGALNRDIQELPYINDYSFMENLEEAEFESIYKSLSNTKIL